ncbi:MAG: hypothetical protein HDR30_05705 [Lachnospiraceae bacterium]|nr:hypothetical protein [Lachnospiraceae bacterium]
MCMTKVVVMRSMLGAREIGWELWNKDKGEVVEMTAKEIKSALLKGDPIYGLAVSEDGELELDKDFFMRNLMEHRHVNNYTPMIEDETCVANVAYIVTGKVDNGYEIISTKWERKVVTEDMLKMFLSMGLVFGGAKLEEDKVVLPDLGKKEEKKPTEPKGKAAAEPKTTEKKK